MLQGIKFDNLHSYEDLGLILKNKEIGTPTPKTYGVDIPGADGKLDLTEYLGEIKYENRPLTFEFEIIKKQEDFVELYSQIQNKLHGKRMKIILDIDPGYYYYGRVYVNEWKSDKKIGKITIEVDADPYKYKLNKTTYSVRVGKTGREVLILMNSRKPVTPIFTFTADTLITYGETTYQAKAGASVIPDILITEGENLLIFTAAAGTIITVSYQEGAL